MLSYKMKLNETNLPLGLDLNTKYQKKLIPGFYRDANPNKMYSDKLVGFPYRAPITLSNFNIQ